MEEALKKATEEAHRQRLALEGKDASAPQEAAAQTETAVSTDTTSKAFQELQKQQQW